MLFSNKNELRVITKRRQLFQTDDEIWIAGSLKEFGKLIGAIEDEKDKLLDRSYEQVKPHIIRVSNEVKPFLHMNFLDIRYCSRKILPINKNFIFPL